MKDQLIFDATDIDTILDSDNVGAYVRSGKSSALITNHSLFKAAGGTFGFVDGDVTVGSDSVAETGHGFVTGDLVQLTSTGTLPAGLALATDYYIIRVDADNIKFAASAYDAEWGIPVDITAAAGGGTHTVTGFAQEARHLDVFAPLHDGEGNPITSTGGSINVNMTNSPTFSVDLDGVYSGGNTNPDNAGLIAHVRAASPGDAEQTFRSTGGNPNSENIDPANVHALDVNSFGMMWDGSGWDRLQGNSTDGLLVDISNANIQVTQGTSPWVIGDGGGSITIDGTVGISGTVAVTQSGSWSVDSVQSGTWTVGLSEDHNYGAVGASTLRTAAQIGNATGAADFNSGVAGAQTLRVTIATDDVVGVSDAALANGSIANASNTLGAANVAEDVVAAPLANRKYLYIYNFDKHKIYVGASGVSAANGFPISPGSLMELRAGAAVDIEFVGQAGKTPEIRTLELS